MKWASDSASWSKTRHIDVKYHKVREWVALEQMRVEHCPTSAQIADICTKALPADAHLRGDVRLPHGESCEHADPRL